MNRGRGEIIEGLNIKHFFLGLHSQKSSQWLIKVASSHAKIDEGYKRKNWVITIKSKPKRCDTFHSSLVLCSTSFKTKFNLIPSFIFLSHHILLFFKHWKVRDFLWRMKNQMLPEMTNQSCSTENTLKILQYCV